VSELAVAPAPNALCECGHRFDEHTEYDDVPCEGSHVRAPGSFVACECAGFVPDPDSARRAAAVRAIRELWPHRESLAIRRAIHGIVFQTRQASYGS